MKVYRITGNTYAHRLDGKGAARKDQRWTLKGTHVTYTCQTVANAVLENLVHNVDVIPFHHSLVTYEIDEKDITRIEDHIENMYFALQNSSSIGDAMFTQKDCKILSVPSVIVPHERNFIIHADYAAAVAKVVATETFIFDSRLQSIGNQKPEEPDDEMESTEVAAE